MKTNDRGIMRNFVANPILLMALLIIGFCGCGETASVFCQSENTGVKDLEITKVVHLEVKPAKARVFSGDKISLRVMLKNDFYQTIFLPFDRYTDLWEGFNIQIYDARGNLISPTKNVPVNRGIGSMMTNEFQPNDAYELEFELQYYFELEPGEYKVSASPAFFYIKDPTIIIKDGRPTRQSQRFTVSAEATFTIKARQEKKRLAREN